MLQRRREEEEIVDDETEQEEDPLTQARSQARLAANLSSPTTTTNYNPNPPQDQISRIRHGYSALMRTLREERRELVEPQNPKLLELLEQANELHVQVQRTVDATLDARFMAASADLGVEKLKTLPLASNPFTVKDLMQVVGRVMKAAGSLESGLEMIGRVSSRHWRGVVGAETMISLRDVVNQTTQPAKRQKRQRTQDQQVGPAVTPSVLDAQQLQQNQVKETTDLVIEVYEQLEVLLQTNNKLSLMKVICDPNSFAHSVELLFYVSFLVADGRVAVSIDDDTVWLSMCEGEDIDSGKRRNHQIITLCQTKWSDYCRQHNITDALIKLD